MIALMAGHIQPRMIEPITTPRHFVPPSARELRSQAVHRLQVGIFGLCAMLLLVGLASIITERVDQAAEGEERIHEVVAADAEPKKQAADPLADIGVVPAAAPTPSPVPTTSEQGNPLIAE
jgi:hypothetical protein